MIVQQIYTHNAMRNFNYLVVCPQSGEALAIDPFAAETCLQVATQQGWQITHILNTHEHWDHIGGNQTVQQATGAKILAHHAAGKAIEGIDRGLYAGDVIQVGKSAELQVLETPGHTMRHLCVLAHTEQPALFSGDTLFNAGCGNCRHGGDVQALYQTFVQQLQPLANNTLIYPGHDYLENNLRFAHSREPHNSTVQSLLRQVEKQHDPATAKALTLAEEQDINPFLRLHSHEIISELQQHFPELALEDEEQVFVALRQCRDHW